MRIKWVPCITARDNSVQFFELSQVIDALRNSSTKLIVEEMSWKRGCEWSFSWRRHRDLQLLKVRQITNSLGDGSAELVSIKTPNHVINANFPYVFVVDNPYKLVRFWRAMRLSGNGPVNRLVARFLCEVKYMILSMLSWSTHNSRRLVSLEMLSGILVSSFIANSLEKCLESQVLLDRTYLLLTNVEAWQDCPYSQECIQPIGLSSNLWISDESCCHRFHSKGGVHTAQSDWSNGPGYLG